MDLSLDQMLSRKVRVDKGAQPNPDDRKAILLRDILRAAPSARVAVFQTQVRRDEFFEIRD